MKKYLKMAGYIVAILFAITILVIVSNKIFKSYADTPTKEVTEGRVTYEFEAEDINSTTGIAHNVRVKSETTPVTTLTIPSSFKVDNITYTVNSIGNGKESALGDTTDWTEIKIPDKNVEKINANAFKDCTNIKKVVFPATSNCIEIGEYAFYGCTSLSNIQGNSSSNRIPASITTIGDYAFYNCTALEKLDLYTGVTTLGENTFKGTTPLTELTIRSNIEKHNGAFAGHTGITTLIFAGDKATTIYDSMFEGCTGITKLTETNYIASIGEKAFLGCTGLNEHKAITYSVNGNLKVGKDAYRFGGYPEEFTEIPTIDIGQSVDKADVEYYTNGIGKVTMNISSESKQLVRPKDYIVHLDTTASMYSETSGTVSVKEYDENGKETTVTKTKLDIAKESLIILAETIYAENPKNRLAIVNDNQSSYLYMNWKDGSEFETVKKAISEITPKNRTGSADYGGSKTAYYTGTNTNYWTGLRTMSDVIMERKTERDRNVYGIFISDGYANSPESKTTRAKNIISAAQHLQGSCDAVWAVAIALEIDDLNTLDPEGPDSSGGEEDDDFVPPEIDPNDKSAYLRYIRTYWGRKELLLDFPAEENLQGKFNAFMKEVVDISTTSLSDIKFASKLNTDIWEFYTGTEYVNSEGCDITDSQNATFKIDRVGKDKQEFYYYIRLKDDKRDKTDPQLLVSNELTAEYTISGGGYNGEAYNKENGKNALYDVALYLDWVAEGTPPPDIDPNPPTESIEPGKLEITKTGEVLINTEEVNGIITPVYEDAKIQGAEFEVYAKEEIFESENKLYEKDALIKRIVTDENGKAELENLPVGKYYVKEVKAGEGFILNEEVKEFEILDRGEDKTIQKVEIAYKNERQKVNLNGKEGLIVEKTADKKLYKPNEQIVYTIRITNTTQDIIKRILVKETIIQGKFEDISTDNVVKGDDTTVGIRQLKPGESVELKFIVNIGNVTEGGKVVNKVEATGTIEVPDPANPGNTIEKEIGGEAEEEIYVSDKQLNIIKEALKDEYEVGETVQYIIRVINNGLTDITDAVVEEKLLNGEFVNIEEADRSGADVKKVDNQKVTIGKIKPGQMVTLKYEYVISKDTKVTVDNEQRIILGNKVTVKGNTEIPDQNDPDRTTTKQLEDEDTEEVEIKTNSEGNGLGIIKTDIETGETIQGAVIGLYAAENIKGNNGEIVIQRDTLIEKTTTDENGKARYTVDLPLGKYYIKEIEAPEKYMLSEEKIEIDATYRGQEIEIINVNKTLTNRKITLDFSIDKTLSSISVDGENIPIKDNKLIKLEVKSSDVKKANIIANYKIKVKNKVNMAGKVKVLEIVPKGYEVVNAPAYWIARPDGMLETEVSLEGNESTELDISLKWINDESNLGSGTNKAKLDTDDATDTDDDDSQATIIVSVKTGEIVSAIIIIMIIASLGICGYITTQIVSKMGKGPDIKGINFFKNKNK